MSRDPRVDLHDSIGTDWLPTAPSEASGEWVTVLPDGNLYSPARGFLRPDGTPFPRVRRTATILHTAEVPDAD